MKEYFKEIYDLLGTNRQYLPRMLFLFVCGALLDLIGLLLFGSFISLIVSPDSSMAVKATNMVSQLVGADYSAILVIGWSLLFLFGLRLITVIYINHQIFSVSGRISVSLRTELLRRYQHMPYVEWLLRNASEYITNININSHQFVTILVTMVLRALSNMVILIAVIGFLIYTDWRALGLILILTGLTIFFYDKIFRKKLGGYGSDQRRFAISMTTDVRHAMEGIKELRVLGVEEHFTQRLHSNATNWASALAKGQTISSMPSYLIEFSIILFMVVSVSAVWWVGIPLEQTMPVFAVFALGAVRLKSGVSSLMILVAQLRQQRDLVRHLAKDWRELSKWDNDVPSSRTIVNTPDFSRLNVEHISFRYPNAKNDAISDISLTINAGDSVAFIGSSGSGKTTLVDLILGFLQPRKGNITVNGKLLSSDPKELLQYVAYLPQHVFLIDDSLKANVAFGLDDCDIDEEKIWCALSRARLDDLARSLHDGINTSVGDRGLRLSGGQRQRVALARAFYYDKQIIVMDEATSALDNETEQEIVDEINLLKGKTTLIVIAHRLTTVEHCDRIFTLDNGTILSIKS